MPIAVQNLSSFRYRRPEKLQWFLKPLKVGPWLGLSFYPSGSTGPMKKFF